MASLSQSRCLLVRRGRSSWFAGRCCHGPVLKRAVAFTAAPDQAIASRFGSDAQQIGRTVLDGDLIGFERLVAGLRKECVAAAAENISASRALAAQLGGATLDADASAFDTVERQLRALLVRRRQRDIRLGVDDVPPSLVTPSASSVTASNGGPIRPSEFVTGREGDIGQAWDDMMLAPQDFVWSSYPFNDGQDTNAKVLRSFEAEYEQLIGQAGGCDLSRPDLLKATLDLAGAYVKNYELDKADELLEKAQSECQRRGAQWNTKCTQDIATLRFKQNRQPECVELLEELAQQSDPHPTLMENLGIAYNSVGEHRKALSCFEQAVELKGGIAEKEDLWNLGIARKNLGDTKLAVSTLEATLTRFLEDGENRCPVTVAKVRDSLAECHLAAGAADRAVEQYQLAADEYAAHVGTTSPLYGAAADGLSRALFRAGKNQAAFDALLDALDVQGRMDAIHPTPIYELLERAEQIAATTTGGPSPQFDVLRLVPGLNTALRELADRGLDTDGNGGVLLQKAAQIFLECASRAETADGGESQAHGFRTRAAELLRRALPLMEDASAAGDGDLSELCAIASLQLGLVEARLGTSMDGVAE